MIYPKRLEKGGTVGLICPSSAINENDITDCVNVIESMGYGVKLADNLTYDVGGYMAGSGKVRAEWVNRMFADPEVDAIFCIRGGEGSSRMAEFLDLEVIRDNPKILVGYSDVTTLHLILNQDCNLVTFHGPMVYSNMVGSFDEDSKDAFFAAINGNNSYEFKNPEGFPIKVMHEGKASAPVIGGNLSLLSAAMGTPYEMDAKDKIIFIEEVEEPIIKIEKWGYHLRNAGKFRDCKGVLLGQFTDITNKYKPKYDAIECLKDVLADADVPVMYNLQSGHGEKMITVPFGAICNMDTYEGKISFDIER